MSIKVRTPKTSSSTTDRMLQYLDRKDAREDREIADINNQLGFISKNVEHVSDADALSVLRNNLKILKPRAYQHASSKLHYDMIDNIAINARDREITDFDGSMRAATDYVNTIELPDTTLEWDEIGNYVFGKTFQDAEGKQRYHNLIDWASDEYLKVNSWYDTIEKGVGKGYTTGELSDDKDTLNKVERYKNMVNSFFKIAIKKGDITDVQAQMIVAAGAGGDNDQILKNETTKVLKDTEDGILYYNKKIADINGLIQSVKIGDEESSLNDILLRQVKNGEKTEEEASELIEFYKNNPNAGVNPFESIVNQIEALKKSSLHFEQERDSLLETHSLWSNQPYPFIIKSANEREQKALAAFAEINAKEEEKFDLLYDQEAVSEIGPLDEEKIAEFEAREDETEGDIPSSIPSIIFGTGVGLYGFNELAEGWKPGYKKIAKDWVGKKWNRGIQYTKTLFTDPKTIDFLLNDSEFNNILNEIDDLEKGRKVQSRVPRATRTLADDLQKKISKIETQIIKKQVVLDELKEQKRPNKAKIKTLNKQIAKMESRIKSTIDGYKNTRIKNIKNRFEKLNPGKKLNVEHLKTMLRNPKRWSTFNLMKNMRLNFPKSFKEMTQKAPGAAQRLTGGLVSGAILYNTGYKVAEAFGVKGELGKFTSGVVAQQAGFKYIIPKITQIAQSPQGRLFLKEGLKKIAGKSMGNKISAWLIGAGAAGYLGPQAAEPASTIVGGLMTAGGLAWIGYDLYKLVQAWNPELVEDISEEEVQQMKEAKENAPKE